MVGQLIILHLHIVFWWFRLLFSCGAWLQLSGLTMPYKNMRWSRASTRTPETYRVNYQHEILSINRTIHRYPKHISQLPSCWLVIDADTAYRIHRGFLDLAYRNHHLQWLKSPVLANCYCNGSKGLEMYKGHFNSFCLTAFILETTDAGGCIKKATTSRLKSAVAMGHFTSSFEFELLNRQIVSLEQPKK